jgi:hypothetical protein
MKIFNIHTGAVSTPPSQPQITSSPKTPPNKRLENSFEVNSAKYGTNIAKTLEQERINSGSDIQVKRGNVTLQSHSRLNYKNANEGSVLDHTVARGPVKVLALNNKFIAALNDNKSKLGTNADLSTEPAIKEFKKLIGDFAAKNKIDIIIDQKSANFALIITSDQPLDKNLGDKFVKEVLDTFKKIPVEVSGGQKVPLENIVRDPMNLVELDIPKGHPDIAKELGAAFDAATDVSNTSLKKPKGLEKTGSGVAYDPVQTSAPQSNVEMHEVLDKLDSDPEGALKKIEKQSNPELKKLYQGAFEHMFVDPNFSDSTFKMYNKDYALKFLENNAKTDQVIQFATDLENIGSLNPAIGRNNVDTMLFKNLAVDRDAAISDSKNNGVLAKIQKEHGLEIKFMTAKTGGDEIQSTFITDKPISPEVRLAIEKEIAACNDRGRAVTNARTVKINKSDVTAAEWEKRKAEVALAQANGDKSVQINGDQITTRMQYVKTEYGKIPVHLAGFKEALKNPDKSVSTRAQFTLDIFKKLGVDTKTTEANIAIKADYTKLSPSELKFLIDAGVVEVKTGLGCKAICFAPTAEELSTPEKVLSAADAKTKYAAHRNGQTILSHELHDIQVVDKTVKPDILNSKKFDAAFEKYRIVSAESDIKKAEAALSKNAPAAESNINEILKTKQSKLESLKSKYTNLTQTFAEVKKNPAYQGSMGMLIGICVGIGTDKALEELNIKLDPATRFFVDTLVGHAADHLYEKGIKEGVIGVIKNTPKAALPKTMLKFGFSGISGAVKGMGNGLLAGAVTGQIAKTLGMSEEAVHWASFAGSFAPDAHSLLAASSSKYTAMATAAGSKIPLAAKNLIKTGAKVSVASMLTGVFASTIKEKYQSSFDARMTLRRAAYADTMIESQKNSDSVLMKALGYFSSGVNLALGSVPFMDEEAAKATTIMGKDDPHKLARTSREEVFMEAQGIKDKILLKIATKGINSLTSEEKTSLQFLSDAAKEPGLKGTQTTIRTVDFIQDAKGNIEGVGSKMVSINPPINYDKEKQELALIGNLAKDPQKAVALAKEKYANLSKLATEFEKKQIDLYNSTKGDPQKLKEGLVSLGKTHPEAVQFMQKMRELN